MNCPVCHHAETKVERSGSDAESVRRNRRCLKCGHPFQTLELPVGTLETDRAIVAKARELAALVNIERGRDVEVEVMDTAWFHANHAQFIIPLEQLVRLREPYCLGAGPTQPGIYFLFHDRHLIYVGQSVNVSARLLQHWRGGRIQFTEYHSIAAPWQFLDTVERYYLHSYRPVRNCDYPEFVGEAGRYLGRVE